MYALTPSDLQRRLARSQAFSLLQLRPLFFCLSALASRVGSMQRTLAVVLILIGVKIYLEAAGVAVPIALFAAALVAWRVIAFAWALLVTSRKE